MVQLAYLPSPSSGVWQVGPFPVRAYALAIILGVVAAVVIGERRWVARGGSKGLVTDVVRKGARREERVEPEGPAAPESEPTESTP